MAQEIKKPEATQVPAPRYVDPFSAMRAEMDRVFDSFLGRDVGRFPSLWRENGSEIVVPRIDVRETDGEIVVEAELPGMDQKDVNVTLRDGVLTIKGEKKSERDEKQADYHLTERSYGSFERSFRLADDVDDEKIKAAFDKGVLKVSMPKRPESVKAEKKIPIGNN